MQHILQCVLEYMHTWLHVHWCTSCVASTILSNWNFKLYLTLFHGQWEHVVELFLMARLLLQLTIFRTINVLKQHYKLNYEKNTTCIMYTVYIHYHIHFLNLGLFLFFYNWLFRIKFPNSNSETEIWTMNERIVTDTCKLCDRWA